MSCYHDRRLLDREQPKQIWLGILTDELAKFKARCVGFFITLNHVHAADQFPEDRATEPAHAAAEGAQIEGIKEFLFRMVLEYASTFPIAHPIW